MKILHTADLHIGRTLNGISILDQQVHCLNQMINYIKSNPVDYFIIAGDIYDRSVPSKEAIKVVNDFITQINQLHIPLLIISGNHDSGERLAFLASILNQKQIHIVSSEIEIQKICFEAIDFYLSPYYDYLTIANYYEDDSIVDSESALKRQLQSISLDDKINIFIGHHFFADVNMKVSESESERPLQMGGMHYISTQLLNQFDYVALGHLHQPQKVTSEKIRYSGSIYKYSESEVNHNKSFTVIDISKDHFNYTLIPFKFDKDVMIIKGYLKDLLTSTNQHFIYFHLLDTNVQPNAMQQLSPLYPNAIGIKYINIENNISTYLTQDIENTSVSTLFEEYYTNTHQKEMNQTQSKIMKTLFEKGGL